MSDKMNTTPTRNMHLLLVGSGLFAIVFGALTIYSGGAVLFGNGAARIAAGNFVLWVLWFNFLAGFLYIVTGYGLLFKKLWSVPSAKLLAIATLLASAGFAIHILLGNAYEMRTVFAMALRSIVWILIAMISSRALQRKH